MRHHEKVLSSALREQAFFQQARPETSALSLFVLSEACTLIIPLECPKNNNLFCQGWENPGTNVD